MQHTTSEIRPTSPSGPGALAGFEAVCSCGLRMGNTVRTNVELDVRQHIAYFEAKAADEARKARRSRKGA